MPRDTVFSTSSDDRLLPVDWTRLLDDLYAGRHSDYRLDPAVPVVRGQRGLGVHWTRGGGFVQLGPTAVAEDGTDVAVPGHWVDLNWSQCNRLVKFLRNARDQAFGRPE